MGFQALLARCITLLGVLLLAACAGQPASTASFSPGHSIECVPFARALTGIQLSGNAPAWWADAEPRYTRSHAPDTGGILAFRPTSRLPYGHVSVVSRVLSGRRILVTQANWVHGRVTQDQPVVDVSAANDWTAVRVWWEPAHALGTSTYPTYGFILPTHLLDHDAIAAGTAHAAAIAVAYHPGE